MLEAMMDDPASEVGRLPRRVETVEDLRAALGHPTASETWGLVPTMGALHDGHLSLIDRAIDECDHVVVSVFVNPLQFGPGEDFETYPRDLTRDLELLGDRGVEVCFNPEVGRFTPADLGTTVHVSGITEVLEGARRPGHFDGVATIVTKLFAAAQPDRAYFGEKDYQQLLVVRRLVADLDLGVEIVACPLVREPDGLARSSRNVLLSAQDRRHALALSAALAAVAGGWDGDADSARSLLQETLDAAPGVELDYAEIADPHSLAPLSGTVTGPARALVAARVGGVRLIDNIALPVADHEQLGADTAN